MIVFGTKGRGVIADMCPICRAPRAITRPFRHCPQCGAPH